MSHHGYLQTIQNYNNLAKHIDDLQRHLDMLNGDGSWMGVQVVLYDSMFSWTDKCPLTQSPMQTRTEAAINHVKNEQGKIRSQQLAFETGLLDPEMVFRSIGFTNFLSTWLLRQVDPRKIHPNPMVEYVL